MIKPGRAVAPRPPPKQTKKGKPKMNPQKLMAVALCAAACVTTTAFAEDDFISSANTTVIADPVNPKPGMVFKGYNLGCNYSYSKEFQSLKATLDSAAPVKTTVVTSEQFTYKAFQGEVRIQQGVWEGFLNCKRKAQCTFLMKMKGGTTFSGFLLYVNGKKVIGGGDQQSANVDLKVGFNHIVIITQAEYNPVEVSLSPVGSTKPPQQLSPAIMFHDDKTDEGDVI